MRRHELTKDQYERIAHLLPGRKGHVGANAKDNHNFINAIFWILKTGAPWRDLPAHYGKWKNVHRRFSRWCKTGVFDQIFRVLNKKEDQEAKMLLIDSSIVKAHQHSAGARSPSNNEDIGRSRGGLTSKIHCSVTESGCPVAMMLSGGQVHDSQYGLALLQHHQADFVLADKAYASSKILRQIDAMDSQAVIPPHPRSKILRVYDRELYKARNIVERFFNRLKHFRGIATRYAKRSKYFLEGVKFAAVITMLIN